MNREQVLDLAKASGIELPEEDSWTEDATVMATAAALMAVADILGGLVESARAATKAGYTFERWKQAAVAAIDEGSPGATLRATPEDLPGDEADEEGFDEVALPLATVAPAQVSTIRITLMQAMWGLGRYAFQDLNRLNRPILIYSAVNDSKTRPTHRAMSGFMASIDSAIWLIWYPPNGHRCRCKCVALTLEQARARGFIADMQVPEGLVPDEGFGGEPLAPVAQQVQQMVSKKASNLPVELGLALDRAVRRET